MHKILVKKLPLEYQALYEVSKLKKLDFDMLRILRERTKAGRIELGFKSLGKDKLSDKLKNYGNNGKWGRDKMQDLAQQVYHDKKPDNIDLGKWVSVEIECIFPNANTETALVAFIRKHGLTKLVTLKNDGSIHPDRDDCDCGAVDEDNCECEAGQRYGKEIVVTCRFGEWKIIEDICRQLNKTGATVNSTCGLHVHFDCRHLGPRQVTTLGKRIAHCVPALKTILPKSRQDNEYCAITINRHARPDRCNSRDERYAFVNLLSYERHKTLEIRGHSGTTDALKIVNWIRVLQKIMAKRNGKEVNTISGLIIKFELEPDLADYVINRFMKFNTSNARVVDVDGCQVDDIHQDNQGLDSEFNFTLSPADAGTPATVAPTIDGVSAARDAVDSLLNISADNVA